MLTMIDLAREAFSTNNFDLAADIYERIIRGNGPTSDMLLGLADSLARGGHFVKAFQSYTNAYRFGKVTPEKLKHLVIGLVNTVEQGMAKSGGVHTTPRCMFLCELCIGLWIDPATLPCGHTFCRSCVEKIQLKTCKVCNVNYRLNIRNIHSNVVLANLVEKWFPRKRIVAQLKKKANECFSGQDYQKANALYSQAIQIDGTDHLLLSNRSHCYVLMNQFVEALADAEQVVLLRPTWPKGYFRKGCALYSLQRYEDAVVAFLQCLAIDQVSSAKEYLSKALDKILSAPPPDGPKAHALQQHNAILQQMIESNFSQPVLLPNAVHPLSHVECRDRDTARNVSGDLTPQLPVSASNLGSETFELDHLAQAADTVSGDNTGALASPTEAGAWSYSAENDEVKPDHTSIEDLECGLCYRLFYEPVTTPCGHTFCRKCLDRCLDHTITCPMCKGNLAQYLAERRQAVTEAIQSIITTFFTEEYADRCRINEEEMTELTRMGSSQESDVPVFVCILAFPTIPCPLHIFEPRYRLMVRQCMESGTRQFGMCMGVGEDVDDFSEYGCMLEIRDVQYFPDGRSVLDTIGGRRFKVLSRGKRDGYNVAKVELISDKPVEADELEAVNSLQVEIHAMVKSWFTRVPTVHRVRIAQHFGEIPDLESHPLPSPNGPKWAWWAVAVLPIDPRVQMTLLSMSNFHERLIALKKVLLYINRRGVR